MPRHLLTFTRRRMLVAVLLLVGAAMAFFFFRGSQLRPVGRWSAQQQQPVGPLLYTPDGKTLISSGDDPVRLWDPATGALKLTLSTPGSTAGRLAVAPGGDVLGCTRTRRNGKEIHQSAEFWDLRTGSRMATLDGPIVGIAFSPPAPVAATLSYGERSSTVQLWSLPAVSPFAALPPVPSTACAIAFSPDGKLLAVGQLGFVELFDLATMAPVRRFNGPATGYVSAIAFTPDGRTIAGAGIVTGPPMSGGLWTWDVATGRPNVRVDFGHPIHDCSFSADGKTLAVQLLWYVMNRKDRIDVYDVERGRRTCSLSVPRPWMWGAAIAPDAQHLAVGFQPIPPAAATIGLWKIE